MSVSESTVSLDITCPECAARWSASRSLLRGEVVRCPECRAELEVLETSPIRVELAPEVEEDWGE